MDALNTPSKSKLLPENAYRKLKPGETYEPIVPAGDKRAEVTPWSIGLGMIMVAVFTAAAAYIALRAGSGIEASIPIAILAIFFGKMRKQASTILENVMVQSVGQAAGVVAAGATFVVPALYLNELSVQWWHILFACLIGGVLGVVLIVPLRKYFVKDLHGDLPFPEGTAITEVIVTGESTGGGAGKILLLSFALGAGYDFLAEAVHLWNPGVNTGTLLGSLGESASAAGFQLSVAAIAALFGLGYIIGVRYASIIAAGSILSVLVIVPAIALLLGMLHEEATAVSCVGQLRDLPLFGPLCHKLICGPDFVYAGQPYFFDEMLKNPVSYPGSIFGIFVKPIGIGAIAVSALIGIIKMGKIVASSVTLGFKGLAKKGGDGEEVERTQLDLAPGRVLAIQLGATLLMGVFFFVVALTTEGADGVAAYGAGDSIKFALVGMLAGFILSFLFTPVAAQAIAIVGVNPVSGMTLITVVLAISSLIFVGLAGDTGMIVALVVGTAVCTALSTSGALISDFKVGYWIGSTPRAQQVWKFAGVALAAVVVAFVVPLMDASYHFLIEDPLTHKMVSNRAVLPAPQANMIADVSRGLMEDPSAQPWLFYGLGGIVAFVLLMAGVPMLAFALGMYLPISLNLAVLGGAVAAWAVERTGKTNEVRQARKEQGPLIASGLMAGAALIGICIAVLRLPAVGAPIRFLSVGVQFGLVPDTKTGEMILEDKAAEWFSGFPGQLTGLLMFVALGFACYLLARLGAKWHLEGQKEDSDKA